MIRMRFTKTETQVNSDGSVSRIVQHGSIGLIIADNAGKETILAKIKPTPDNDHVFLITNEIYEHLKNIPK